MHNLDEKEIESLKLETIMKKVAVDAKGSSLAGGRSQVIRRSWSEQRTDYSRFSHAALMFGNIHPMEIIDPLISADAPSIYTNYLRRMIRHVHHFANQENTIFKWYEGHDKFSARDFTDFISKIIQDYFSGA